MRRILATYIKEWHQMRRDPGGLALLFLMPMLLIIIMALVQDAPFKDFKDRKFETLFLDQDKGKVGKEIRDGLQESGHFILIDSYKGKELDLPGIRNLIRSGKYQFAIVLKKGISAETVNSANIIANKIGEKIGMSASMPHRESRDSVDVELMFDPVSKPAFRMAITNAIEKFLEKVQSEVVLERISKLNPDVESKDSFDFEKVLHQVGVIEIPSGDSSEVVGKMNSVQHNVPAWAIFGMFFMTIIISESMISERLSGSWTRIKLIPGNFAHILIGKLIFYVMLGIIQFYLMMLVGVYLMPLMGLDSLIISKGPLMLFIMVTCISTCAVTFGILAGLVFNSSNQALPVAAISVVILSAVGGIWVPIEVLPPVLRKISMISPMRWGLQGINDILLRQSHWTELLQPWFVLLGGSAITLFVAWLIEKKRSF